MEVEVANAEVKLGINAFMVLRDRTGAMSVFRRSARSHPDQATGNLSKSICLGRDAYPLHMQ